MEELTSFVDSYKELEHLNEALKQKASEVNQREVKIKSILTATEEQWVIIQEEREKLEERTKSILAREEALKLSENANQELLEKERLALKLLSNRKLKQAKREIEAKGTQKLKQLEQEWGEERKKLDSKVQAQTSTINQLKRAKAKCQQEAEFQKQRYNLVIKEKESIHAELTQLRVKFSKVEFERDNLRTKLRVFEWKRSKAIAEADMNEQQVTRETEKKYQTRAKNIAQIDDPKQHSWKRSFDLLEQCILHNPLSSTVVCYEQASQELKPRRILPGLLFYLNQGEILQDVCKPCKSSSSGFGVLILELTFRCVAMISEGAYKNVFQNDKQVASPGSSASWKRIPSTARVPTHFIRTLLYLIGFGYQEEITSPKPEDVFNEKVDLAMEETFEPAKTESIPTSMLDMQVQSEGEMGRLSLAVSQTNSRRRTKQGRLLESSDQKNRVLAGLIACECFLLLDVPHGPNSVDVEALINSLTCLRRELTNSPSRELVVELEATRTLYSLAHFAFVPCPKEVSQLVSACLLLMVHDDPCRTQFLAQTAISTWFVDLCNLAFVELKNCLKHTDLWRDTRVAERETQSTSVEMSNVLSLVLEQLLHPGGLDSRREGRVLVDKAKQLIRTRNLGSLLHGCILSLGFTNAASTSDAAVQTHIQDLPAELQLFSRNAMEIIRTIQPRV